MSEDIKTLREEHWHKFVTDFVEPLKNIDFPEIDNENEFNNYKVIRKNDDIKLEPSMPELDFIFNLINAQNNKKKLIPYIWAWAFALHTTNISDYCIKRLYKTLCANGFNEYQGTKYSIKFQDTDFDKAIKSKLSDIKMTNKDFVDAAKRFINDYQIVNELP